MDKIFVTRSSMPELEEYVEEIRDLWETHWLTNMGVKHEQFTEALEDFLDVPNISLFCNGHMGLEMTIQAMNFPKGSEIITTPFTFASTTHAIVRNDLKPVFCDIREDNYTIDAERIEALITDKTVAILPVHVYGNICNIEKIQEIAFRHNLKVIYDAAHAFGVSYKGRGIGSYGDASVFSFHATKVFNTIEGGAVTSSDARLHEKLSGLKNFGIRSEELVTEIGANAKMNEFAAIMGLCNLDHIVADLEERRKRYEIYRNGLNDIHGIRLLRQRKDASQNYSYLPIVVEDDYSLNRDELYYRLKEHNIFARKYFYPLTSDQSCFGDSYIEAKINNARKLSAQILSLPLYPTLETEAISRILQIIKQG